MPLIDLKTNLKDIKYGMDRLGGGWSGQPFVQFPIQGYYVLPTLTQYYSLNRSNPDYPIRGGSPEFNLGTQTFTYASQIDKDRIKKFMESKPRGKAFLDKQIGLQLSNPKTETGNSFQVAPGSNRIPGLLENTRIYNNGKNTLQQVGYQGTGVHVPRHGIVAMDYASKYYRDVVGAQNINNNASTNRLLILAKLKLATSSKSVSLSNITEINKLGISLNRNYLFQYLGGPGSVYGIGNTTVKRYEDTSKAAIKIKSIKAMTYDDIMSQKVNTFNATSGSMTTNIQDFKNPGEKFQSREDIYYMTTKGQADKMQALKSFLFANDRGPWEVDDWRVNTGTKDMIKFVFEAIENNDPKQSWAIFFRAMLNGGITDNHQASINSFKYLGRGEDFYTYQGVSRAISFAFRIPVSSKEELKPIYTKLNHLISQCYPDYSQTFGIMRAPVVRITIGDYFYRLAGMLESVNVTVDDTYSWEINYENDKDLRQLPQIINVQCTFKPIHDFVPRRENINQTNVPFMTKPGEDYVSIKDPQVAVQGGTPDPVYTSDENYNRPAAS